MECNKHPEDFDGLSPEEFATRLVSMSVKFKEEFFGELKREYKDQSIGDRERKRVKLSRSLENHTTSVYLISKEIVRDNADNSSIERFYDLPEDVAEGFGFTNYFYQREVFKELEKMYGRPEGIDLSKFFGLAVKSIDKVCNSCVGKMDNPFS